MTDALHDSFYLGFCAVWLVVALGAGLALGGLGLAAWGFAGWLAGVTFVAAVWD